MKPELSFDKTVTTVKQGDHVHTLVELTAPPAPEMERLRRAASACCAAIARVTCLRDHAAVSFQVDPDHISWTVLHSRPVRMTLYDAWLCTIGCAYCLGAVFDAMVGAMAGNDHYCASYVTKSRGNSRGSPYFLKGTRN